MLDCKYNPASLWSVYDNVVTATWCSREVNGGQVYGIFPMKIRKLVTNGMNLVRIGIARVENWDVLAT